MLNPSAKQERQLAIKRHKCLVNYLCKNPKHARAMLDKWDRDAIKSDYAKLLRKEARDKYMQVRGRVRRR